MTWSEIFKYSPKIIRKALGEYDKKKGEKDETN